MPKLVLKTCAVCGSTPTLRKAGKDEFCKTHEQDAFDAMRKIGHVNESFSTK
jgi:hypothetical protein